MSRRKWAWCLAAAGAMSFLSAEALFGWPWSTDMFAGPAIRTYAQAPLEPPAGALAVDGEPPLDRAAADQTLSNPVPATPESIARGQVGFETFCFPCHGPTARGDGPVTKKFVPPPDLTDARYAQVSDGYFYGTIRNGGAVMPAQGAALSPEERWDVVNFIRSLQKP